MFPGETIASQRELGMPEDKHVSEFRVMHSGGGIGPVQYYIGTIYTACGDEDCKACREDEFQAGFQYPNSRETDYFETEQAANDALEKYKKTGWLEGERY